MPGKRRSTLMIVLLVLLSLACQFGTGLVGAQTTPTSAIDQQVISLVGSIDPGKPETLSVPEKLIKLGRPAASALMDLVDSPSFPKRWAALYYFSRMAQKQDIPGLAKGLDDENMSNRTVAAATLLRLGDARGLSILKEASQSVQPLAFSEPPELLADYAKNVLNAYSANPPALADAAAPAAPILARPDVAAATIEPSFVSSVHLAAPVRPVTMVSDCSVTVQDCDVTVTLNLQFWDAATQPMVDAWNAAIMHVWDGLTTTSGCKLHLVLNTLVGGAPQDGYALIDVVQIAPGYQHRSTTTLGNSSVPHLTGEWGSDISGFVAAHEVGHLMGIDDDYQDDDNGVSRPNPDAQGDADLGKPDIMAQTWQDDTGDLPSAQPRHADDMMKAYGVTCHCDKYKVDAPYWGAQGILSGVGLQITGNICSGLNTPFKLHGENTLNRYVGDFTFTPSGGGTGTWTFTGTWMDFPLTGSGTFAFTGVPGGAAFIQDAQGPFAIQASQGSPALLVDVGKWVATVAGQAVPALTSPGAHLSGMWAIPLLPAEKGDCGN